MTLGKLAYLLFYRPIATLRKIKKAGVFDSLKSYVGRLKMKKLSRKLKEIKRESGQVYEIYFLTGKKYWYQTAFCLYSLQKSLATAQINGVFVDDGTFDQTLIHLVNQQFPSSRIRLAEETDLLVNQFLPEAKYPMLNKKRKIYPHIRKLIDVHIGSKGWKMVLDSDMLFFSSPNELVKWLTEPDKPFFLFDPVCSYHYSTTLMNNLVGNQVRLNLNVGMIGLESSSISWLDLERWIVALEAAEGDHYFLEQALSAMLVAGRDIYIADPKGYIVMPDKKEVKTRQAILHHYVADSKNWFYQSAWKQLL